MNQQFEELRRQLRVLMNEITDVVAVGRCQDFAEYKLQTGIIQGLALAERTLLDLAERYDRMESEGEITE